jgi:hypothetical protein
LEQIQSALAGDTKSGSPNNGRQKILPDFARQNYFHAPCRFRRAPLVVLMEANFGRTTSPLPKGDIPMRVMVIVKADKNSEAGILPKKELFEKMGKYNKELVKAGIMLAAEGLQATSKGKRVRFSGTQRTVIDGPFTESKELIAGFWLWQVRSMDEAVEWLKRAPFDGGTEIEIRQVFEAEDLGAELAPKLKEQEARLRAQASKK